MIYYYNRIKLLLFFVFVLIILNLLLCAITEVFCAVYSNNIDVCSNKRLYYQVDTDQQLKQLVQISDAHSQCLIQLQQQLSENQQDLDKLRGHIQNIQHHISEIILDQKELYKNLNQVLKKNSGIQLSTFNHEQNSLNHDDIKDSITNEVDTDYKTAVKLVLEKKQYIQAIQSFQDFIKKYPKSNYQPNAHYWLGQLYYNQGHKHDASYHFALVVKNYPKSSKASDALLKIGIIMQEKNQTDKAKTIYRQVGKLYPNSDAAKQAQKRLLYLS